MPIVTTAVIAVGAAIATTTLATVATAAMAVGTLVGTVGLGMSVIGMTIGNKTLTKIGGYLGMAGGVLSVGGALAGGMSGFSSALGQAWDDGVGSLFSSTKSVGQEALSAGALQEKLGKSIVDNSLAQQAAAGQTVAPASASPTSIPPPSAALGPRPQVLPPPSSTAGSSSTGANPLNFAGSAPAGSVRPDMAVTQFANAAPKAAPLSTQGLAAATSQANAAPVVGAKLPDMSASQWVAPVASGASPGSAGGGIGSFFSGLPDWAKAQVAISGAQGIAGMAGGWFESASAEERLALEREAQQWRMQHEDRAQNFNQRNASYAPTVSFGGGGMLSRGSNS